MMCRLLLLIAATSLALTGCFNTTAVRLGAEFPQVALADVHGNMMTLPADLRGKVALVRFWSITCPSCCKELLKALELLQQKYKDQGFVAVAINVDPPPEGNEEFQKLTYVHYPFLVDPGWAVAKSIGIKSVPVTFILDSKGIVREKIGGEAPPEFFEQIMTQVLYKGNYHDLPMQNR